MKAFLFNLFTAAILSVGCAQAQYAVTIVGDPIAIQNHIEDIAKWTQSIQTLNQQLQQAQQAFALAQQVKGYMGDPAAAASAVNLLNLGNNQLIKSVGQLTSTINQTVNGATALQNSGSQLFSPIQLTTPSGLPMAFVSSQFNSFSAIQNQNSNLANVITTTLNQIKALQEDKASTLLEIQAAPTQSIVQKLMAKVSAIDGQIAQLSQQQQTAQTQIVAQNIANQNNKDMAAQAANQSADHELSVSLQNIMQWQGQVTSNRTPYQ